MDADYSDESELVGPVELKYLVVTRREVDGAVAKICGQIYKRSYLSSK